MIFLNDATGRTTQIQESLSTQNTITNRIVWRDKYANIPGHIDVCVRMHTCTKSYTLYVWVEI